MQTLPCLFRTAIGNISCHISNTNTLRPSLSEGNIKSLVYGFLQSIVNIKITQVIWPKSRFLPSFFTILASWGLWEEAVSTMASQCCKAHPIMKWEWYFRTFLGKASSHLKTKSESLLSSQSIEKPPLPFKTKHCFKKMPYMNRLLEPLFSFSDIEVKMLTCCQLDYHFGISWEPLLRSLLGL